MPNSWSDSRGRQLPPALFARASDSVLASKYSQKGKKGLESDRKEDNCSHERNTIDGIKQVFQKLRKHAGETKDSIETYLKPSTAPRLQSKTLRHRLSDNYLTRWMEKQKANKKAGKPNKTNRPWPHSSFSDHNKEIKNKQINELNLEPFSPENENQGEIYMSTIDKPIHIGEPVVLIGFLEKENGASEKVAILGTVIKKPDEDKLGKLEVKDLEVEVKLSDDFPDKNLIKKSVDGNVYPVSQQSHDSSFSGDSFDPIKPTNAVPEESAPKRKFYSSIRKVASSLLHKMKRGANKDSQIQAEINADLESYKEKTSGSKSTKDYLTSSEPYISTASTSGMVTDTKKSDFTSYPTGSQSDTFFVGRKRTKKPKTSKMTTSQSDSYLEQIPEPKEDSFCAELKLGKKMKGIRHNIRLLSGTEIERDLLRHRLEDAELKTTKKKKWSRQESERKSKLYELRKHDRNRSRKLSESYEDASMVDAIDPKQVKKRENEIKEQLDLLQISRPDLRSVVLKRIDDPGFRNQTSSVSDSTSSKSTSSNTLFYKKLSSMVKSVVKDGRGHEIDQNVYEGLLSAGHEYDEIAMVESIEKSRAHQPMASYESGQHDTRSESSDETDSMVESIEKSRAHQQMASYESGQHDTRSESSDETDSISSREQSVSSEENSGEGSASDSAKKNDCADSVTYSDDSVDLDDKESAEFTDRISEVSEKWDSRQDLSDSSEKISTSNVMNKSSEPKSSSGIFKSEQKNAPIPSSGIVRDDISYELEDYKSVNFVKIGRRQQTQSFQPKDYKVLSTSYDECSYNIAQCDNTTNKIYFMMKDITKSMFPSMPPEKHLSHSSDVQHQPCYLPETCFQKTKSSQKSSCRTTNPVYDSSVALKEMNLMHRFLSQISPQIRADLGYDKSVMYYGYSRSVPVPKKLKKHFRKRKLPFKQALFARLKEKGKIVIGNRRTMFSTKTKPKTEETIVCAPATSIPKNIEHSTTKTYAGTKQQKLRESIKQHFKRTNAKIKWFQTSNLNTSQQICAQSSIPQIRTGPHEYEEVSYDSGSSWIPYMSSSYSGSTISSFYAYDNIYSQSNISIILNNSSNSLLSASLSQHRSEISSHEVQQSRIVSNKHLEGFGFKSHVTARKQCQKQKEIAKRKIEEQKASCNTSHLLKIKPSNKTKESCQNNTYNLNEKIIKSIESTTRSDYCSASQNGKKHYSGSGKNDHVMPTSASNSYARESSNTNNENVSSTASVVTNSNCQSKLKSLHGQNHISHHNTANISFSSQSISSGMDSHSFKTSSMKHFPKDLIRLGAMDYSSSNLSEQSIWWQECSEKKQRNLDSPKESMSPQIDSSENEIRECCGTVTPSVPAGPVRSTDQSDVNASLFYLRGDGLLMSQYFSKKTFKKPCSPRKYGMRYPSLEDIHCVQTIGRLQTSAVTKLLRSDQLRLTCNKPECMYMRNITSDSDFISHLPVRNWKIQSPEKELKVTLDETKQLISRGSEIRFNAKTETPSTSNRSKFHPYFPTLYEKHGLAPLAKSIVSTVIIGAKDLYYKKFSYPVLKKKVEKVGDNVAIAAFEIGVAHYLVKTATTSSQIDLKAEFQFYEEIRRSINDVIKEALADLQAETAIVSAKRLLIIDEYIKTNSPSESTTTMSGITEVRMSCRSRSLAQQTKDSILIDQSRKNNHLALCQNVKAPRSIDVPPHKDNYNSHRKSKRKTSHKVVHVINTPNNSSIIEELKQAFSVQNNSHSQVGKLRENIRIKRKHLSKSLKSFSKQTFEKNKQDKLIANDQSDDVNFEDSHLTRWKRCAKSRLPTPNVLIPPPHQCVTVEASSSPVPMKDYRRKHSKKVKRKNTDRFPKPSSHSIFDNYSSVQSENNSSKNCVFGRAPLNLIKKFGNMAKGCSNDALEKISDSKAEIEACAPIPSGRIASSTEESSNDSDYIIFKIVPSRAEKSYQNRSKAIDLTRKSTDPNLDLTNCDTNNAQTRLHTKSNDFYTSSHQKVESASFVSYEPVKYLTPSGVPHPCKATHSNNSFSYSSSDVSGAMRKLLNDESEARYTENTSISTDYEYLSDINSICKTNSSRYHKRNTEKSSTYSELSTTQSYSRSIASKKSSYKLSLMRKVTIGNRYKNPVNAKTVKCESLHSIASTSSSFLDRKYRGLAYGSMNIPAKNVIREVINEHACTQTEKRSSSDSLKRIISQHSSLTTSNHNNSTNSSTVCGRAKNVRKISSEGLNEHFTDHKSLAYDLVPSASTKLMTVKLKKSWLKSSMCQTECGSFEKEPTKVYQIDDAKPFSPNGEAEAKVSVGCETNLQIDFSQPLSSSHDVLPEDFETVPVEMETKNNENKQTSPSSQGIKMLLNELNDEINGVRKVVKNSKANSSYDETTSEPQITAINNLPQASERFVSNDSLTGQLADMINELQSTLFSYVNEITKKKTIQFSSGVSFRNPLNLISNLNSSSFNTFNSDDSEATEFSDNLLQPFDSKTRSSCRSKHKRGSSKKKCRRRNISTPKASKTTALKKFQASTMNAVKSFLKPGPSLSSEKVFRRKDYIIAQEVPGSIKLYQYQDKNKFYNSRRSSTEGNGFVSKESESKSETDSNLIPRPSCRPLRRKKMSKKLSKLKQTDRSPKQLVQEAKTNTKRAKADFNREAENKCRAKRSSHDDPGRFVPISQAKSLITHTAKSPSMEKSGPIIDPPALKVVIGSLSKAPKKSMTSTKINSNNGSASKTISSASTTSVRSVTFENEKHNSKCEKPKINKKRSRKSAKRSTCMKDIEIDEKVVDQYFMKKTEPSMIYNNRSAHSIANESNDSIQLSVPILTNYFENRSEERVEVSQTSDLNITDQNKTENETTVHCDTEKTEGYSVSPKDKQNVLKNKRAAGILITPGCLFSPRPRDSAESTVNGQFHTIPPSIYNEISKSNSDGTTKYEQICEDNVVIGKNYDNKTLQSDTSPGQVKRIGLVQMFATVREPRPAKQERLESIQKQYSSTLTISSSDFNEQHISSSVHHQVKSCVEQTISADSDREGSRFYSSSNSRCEREVRKCNISKQQKDCIDSANEILRPSAGKPPIILVSKGSSPVSIISRGKGSKEDVSNQQQISAQSHQRFSKEDERKSNVDWEKSDTEEDGKSDQNQNFNDQDLSSSDKDDKKQQQRYENEFFRSSDERHEDYHYRPASGHRHSSQYHLASDKRLSSQYFPASDKRHSSRYDPASDKRQSSHYHPAANKRQSSQYDPASDKRLSSRYYPASNRRKSSRYLPASNKRQSSQYHPASDKRRSSHYHPASDKRQSSQYYPASDKRQSSQYYPASDKRQSSQYYPASNKRQSSQYYPASDKRQSSQYHLASDKRQSSQYHPASDKRQSSQYHPASNKGRGSTRDEFFLASDLIDQKRLKKDNRIDFRESSTNDQFVFASDKYGKKSKTTDRASHHQKTSHDQFFFASDFVTKHTPRKRKIAERRKSSQDEFFFTSDVDHKKTKRNDVKQRVSSADEFFLASDVDPVVAAKGGHLQSAKKFPEAETEQTNISKDYLSHKSRDGPFYDSGDSANASQLMKPNKKQLQLEAGDSLTSFKEVNQVEGSSLDFISSLPKDFEIKHIPSDCYHAKHSPILCGDCSERHQCDMYSMCKCLTRKNLQSKLVKQCHITTQTKRDSDTKHKRKQIKQTSSSRKDCPCPSKVPLLYDAKPFKPCDRGRRSRHRKSSKVKQDINFLQGLDIFKNLLSKNSTSNDSTDCPILESKNTSCSPFPNLLCNEVRKKGKIDIEEELDSDQHCKKIGTKGKKNLFENSDSNIKSRNSCRARDIKTNSKLSSDDVDTDFDFLKTQRCRSKLSPRSTSQKPCQKAKLAKRSAPNFSLSTLSLKRVRKWALSATNSICRVVALCAVIYFLFFYKPEGYGRRVPT